MDGHKHAHIENRLNAQKEWLKHLEELVLEIMWSLRDADNDYDRLEFAEQKYNDQMENL